MSRTRVTPVHARPALASVLALLLASPAFAAPPTLESTRKLTTGTIGAKALEAPRLQAPRLQAPAKRVAETREPSRSRTPAAVTPAGRKDSAPVHQHEARRDVPGDALEARRAGDQLLGQGDRAAALARYEAALEVHHRDPGLWQLVGDLRFHLDLPDGAYQAWLRSRALVHHPSDGLLQRLTAGATRVGDFAYAAESARELADRLAERLDSYADTRMLHHIGTAYLRTLVNVSELAILAGDYTTAEEAAREAMKHDEAGVSGRLALAYVHLQAAEHDEAEDVYREVLELDPAHPIALNNLGNIHYMRKDLDGAARLFEAVLEIPDVRAYSESIALANLAELMQLHGAFDAADQLYTASIDAHDGAWGHMGRAQLLDLMGDHDGAYEAMIEGWERDQNRMTRLNMHFYQPEWYWQRDALIAEIEGDLDAARTLWTQVLDGDIPGLWKSADYHLQALDAR